MDSKRTRWLLKEVCRLQGPSYHPGQSSLPGFQCLGLTAWSLPVPCRHTWQFPRFYSCFSFRFSLIPASHSPVPIFLALVLESQTTRAPHPSLLPDSCAETRRWNLLQAQVPMALPAFLPSQSPGCCLSAWLPRLVAGMGYVGDVGGACLVWRGAVEAHTRSETCPAHLFLSLMSLCILSLS